MNTILVTNYPTVHCMECMYALYYKQKDRKWMLHHPNVDYCQHSGKYYEIPSYELKELSERFEGGREVKKELTAWRKWVKDIDFTWRSFGYENVFPSLVAAYEKLLSCRTTKQFREFGMKFYDEYLTLWKAMECPEQPKLS